MSISRTNKIYKREHEFHIFHHKNILRSKLINMNLYQIIIDFLLSKNFKSREIWKSILANNLVAWNL
jgi:hypothetical protein